MVDGEIEACGNRIEAGNMLVSKEEDVCKIHIPGPAHLLVFGGKPFAEQRHIFWNFVGSDKDTIKEAKEQWKSKTVPMIEGDNSYIPLP